MYWLILCKLIVRQSNLENSTLVDTKLTSQARSIWKNLGKFLSHTGLELIQGEQNPAEKRSCIHRIQVWPPHDPSTRTGFETQEGTY